MSGMWSADCWCYTCDVNTSGGPPMFRRMNICPQCGNKRCPRATYHEHTCSGSNEPNQPGSIYQYRDRS